VLGSAIDRADVTEIIRATQHASFEPLISALQNAREQGWIRSDLDPADTHLAHHLDVVPGRGGAFRVDPRAEDLVGPLQTEAALSLLFGETPGAPSPTRTEPRAPVRRE